MAAGAGEVPNLPPDTPVALGAGTQEVSKGRQGAEAANNVQVRVIQIQALPWAAWNRSPIRCAAVHFGFDCAFVSLHSEGGYCRLHRWYTHAIVVHACNSEGGCHRLSFSCNHFAGNGGGHSLAAARK